MPGRPSSRSISMTISTVGKGFLDHDVFRFFIASILFTYRLPVNSAVSPWPTPVPSSNYKLVNGQKDFYYGHISYADLKNDGRDPVVFREGRLTPEIAILNLPLGPGDAIQTTAERRTEIQFDNGTIVRLDF